MSPTEKQYAAQEQREAEIEQERVEAARRTDEIETIRLMHRSAAGPIGHGTALCKCGRIVADCRCAELAETPMGKVLAERGPAHLAAQLRRAEEALARACSQVKDAESEKHRLELRLEDERKRREMAAICLDDLAHINKLRIANHQPRIGLAELIELARVVLDERELRAECEDCAGPCSADGKRCMLCGHSQAIVADADRCPKRDEACASILAGR